MTLTKLIKLFIVILVSVLITACATLADPNQDTTESPEFLNNFNKKSTKLNLALDTYFARPLAVFTKKIIPSPILSGIGNLNSSLDAPVSILNATLAGEPKYAIDKTGDLILNVVFGFGVINWSNTIKSPSIKFDLSTTLYKYGVKNGYYIQVPLAGPKTILTSTDLFTSSLEKSIFYKTSSAVFNPLLFAAFLLKVRIDLLSTDQFIYNTDNRFEVLKSVYLQNLKFRQHNLLGIQQEQPEYLHFLDDL